MCSPRRRIFWVLTALALPGSLLPGTEWANADDLADTVPSPKADAPASQPIPASEPALAGPERLEPAANRILRDWSTFLAKTDRFEVDVHTSVRVQGAEQTTDLKSVYHLVVERPNRLAVRPQRPDLDPTLVSDGKTLYSFLPVAKQYTREPAPETLDRLLAGNSARVLLAGGSALAHLTLVLSQDPFDNLTILATGGRLVGTDPVDDTPCDHVCVLQHYFEFGLWIESGPRPLLRKMVPSIVPASQPASAPQGPESPEPAGKVKLETKLTFSNWVFKPSLSAEAFHFVPPPGARLVERLLGSVDADQPDPMVGRPAPDFTAPLLDGSTFRLADHKGRSIVVLDFWASWSSGSAERLPTVARLADELADRPVIFLAINVADMERFARPFLEKNGIKTPVALDHDGNVARLYGIPKLPHTIVINNEGRVAAVFDASPAQIGSALRAEIEGLLAPSAGAQNQQP